MDNRDAFDIRLTELELRRRLDYLRDQLYFRADPDSRAAVEAELLQAEQDLQRIEEQSMAEKPTGKQGVLMQVEPLPGQMDQTTGVKATVLLRQSHVPTGHVHLLDPEKNPLVTFQIQYLGDEYTRVRASSFVEEYSAKCITTVELDKDHPKCKINHLPTFFPERLHAVTELTRATLHIQIDDLDKTIEQENTFTIWLLARTSAYLCILDPAKRKWIDLTHFLAAWVTPNAPAVMRLLRRAVDFLTDKRMVGYQADPQGVEAQVRAIFEALKEQGIHYINSTLSFGAGQGEKIQRIRLPRESLETKSANCIDGTVLMASLLEAASLNPAIVLTPGHAFLAWERAAGANDWDYLETTMIGSHDFEAAHTMGQIQVARRTPKLLPLTELRLKHGITPME